ncbi:Unknown protein, partial [Striga hermonthica]
VLGLYVLLLCIFVKSRCRTQVFQYPRNFTNYLVESSLTKGACDCSLRSSR